LIVFDFDFDTISHTATTTVSEIPVGEWNLTVNALDENEIVTHSASTTVLIHSGLNEVNLTFEAVSGDLIVNVAWLDTTVMLNMSDLHFYEWSNDTAIEINPDNIFRIYHPLNPLDRSLHIKFNQNQYIDYIYFDRNITFQDSTGNTTGNYIDVKDEWPEKTVKSFLKINYLSMINPTGTISYADSFLYIVMRDPDTDESRGYGGLIIWPVQSATEQ
ncbi:MAG: hypothetical protein KDD94_15475, partial [Calditrichaeota bacterium]|nr:hypothetical protein [Calditrichota bacterium]